MQHPGFFLKTGPFRLSEIAQYIGATLIDSSAGQRRIADVRPLLTASTEDLSFFSNRRYADQLAETRAGACIVGAGDAGKVPESAAILTASSPYAAFARVLQMFYDDAMHSKAAASRACPSGELVHSSALIGANVVIEPGAVVSREAVIGDGTTVAAGAVIGYRVVVGKGCHIGAGSVVTHALLGDNITIHPGVRIGQDGFGFAPGAGGHLKVPQVGAVVIGDDVEIGANTTIDRGTLSNTVIGAGCKIDNLVQIGHNVVMGRHCIIVAQSGIAGSAELGDYVVMGAQSGVLGHVKVGTGAQIAGMAHVKNDVEPGARMGGTPARPFREWAREVAALHLLGKRSK